MSSKETSIKVKILDFLELAYKADKGITASIYKSKGPFTLKVDERGVATIVSSVGRLTYSINSEDLQSIAGRISRVSLSFSSGYGSKMVYTGTVELSGVATVSLSSSVDLFELIKSCSGFLCNAARLLSGRTKEVNFLIDRSLHGH